jgi:hypothetical protein
MVRERLRALLQSYDPTVQQIVGEVIELEQVYISMSKPRGVKQDIDAVIEKYAQEELKNPANGLED